MPSITNSSFKTPVIGTDPVTKGTFKITWANMLYDYDDDELQNVRASGNVIIEGYVNGISNPLYETVKANPLRVQGLVASVIFGTEKKFIRFEQLSDYSFVEDELIKEIEFSLVFNILDNLEYLELINQYKENIIIHETNGM
jgi:hypothetical protein